MISHASGKCRVAQLFSVLTNTAPIIGPTNVPRPPTATQTKSSFEAFFRDHLAGVNDAHLRNEKRSCDARNDCAGHKDEELEISGSVAGK